MFITSLHFKPIFTWCSLSAVVMGAVVQTSQLCVLMCTEKKADKWLLKQWMADYILLLLPRVAKRAYSEMWTDATVGWMFKLESITTYVQSKMHCSQKEVINFKCKTALFFLNSSTACVISRLFETSFFFAFGFIMVEYTGNSSISLKATVFLRVLYPAGEQGKNLHL